MINPGSNLKLMAEMSNVIVPALGKGEEWAVGDTDGVGEAVGDGVGLGVAVGFEVGEGSEAADSVAVGGDGDKVALGFWTPCIRSMKPPIMTAAITIKAMTKAAVLILFYLLSGPEHQGR